MYEYYCFGRKKKKRVPFTYGENFPSTNLKWEISYIRIGVPSQILKKYRIQKQWLRLNS